MSAKKEAKLKNLLEKVKLMEQKLNHYKELFLADGRIDAQEQKKLDEMEIMVAKIYENIEKRQSKLEDNTLLNSANATRTKKVRELDTLLVRLESLMMTHGLTL